MSTRIAVVTGAGGQGMGRSIALTLARDGCDVVLNWRRSDDAARRTAAAIEAMGRRVILHQADVSEAAQAAGLIAAAEAAFGHVDVLVASAGAPWKPQDIADITPEHLRAVLAAEVESVYALLRAVLPGMRARAYGRIVLIGGHMADDWRFGPPDAPLDYPLGKAARHWLVRTLAPRERPHGITLNAVAPGPTRRFTHNEAIAALEKPSAAGENTPQHIAETVAWLCSDAAARITGAVIPVPGARPV